MFLGVLNAGKTAFLGGFGVKTPLFLGGFGPFVGGFWSENGLFLLAVGVKTPIFGALWTQDPAKRRLVRHYCGGVLCATGGRWVVLGLQQLWSGNATEDCLLFASFKNIFLHPKI